jgi:hypothetical protein
MQNLEECHAYLEGTAGGGAYSPSSFGIGADPGHREHRRPSTNVPTDASGWRSMVRRSIARSYRRDGEWHREQIAKRPSLARSLDGLDAAAPILSP